MSPRTADQFEKIRGKSKKNIERIALELFAFKGYHATSVSMIAEKAGISKGLLYNYYDSKDDLLNTLILQVFDELMKVIKPPEDIPAQKQLEQIITQTILHLKENKTFWRLYLFLIHQSGVQKKMSRHYENLRTDYMEYVVKLFKETGSENPEMDAMMMGTMFDGIGLNYVTAPKGYPIEEIGKYMIKVFTRSKKR